MKTPFTDLDNWTLEVLMSIKKDIRTEHLQSDMEFYRNYFGNRPANRLTTDEIFAAYEKELVGGNASLAEWVVNRWVFKHGDLYEHFADKLSQVNPHFDQIKELTLEESNQILEGAKERFGAIPTYLFALLNGVVFPESVREELKRDADTEKQEMAKRGEQDLESLSLEKTIEAKDREIKRLESKILGVQKKYTRDTESLKKQIKALQKRLA